MAEDVIRIDAPAAKDELAWFKGAGVGSTRTGVLMPGLPADLDWVVTKAEEGRWEMDALFCGVLLMAVIVSEVQTALVLTVKE